MLSTKQILIRTHSQKESAGSNHCGKAVLYTYDGNEYTAVTRVRCSFSVATAHSGNKLFNVQMLHAFAPLQIERNGY